MQPLSASSPRRPVVLFNDAAEEDPSIPKPKKAPKVDQVLLVEAELGQ